MGEQRRRLSHGRDDSTISTRRSGCSCGRNLWALLQSFHWSRYRAVYSRGPIDIENIYHPGLRQSRNLSLHLPRNKSCLYYDIHSANTISLIAKCRFHALRLLRSCAWRSVRTQALCPVTKTHTHESRVLCLFVYFTLLNCRSVHIHYFRSLTSFWIASPMKMCAYVCVTENP